MTLADTMMYHGANTQPELLQPEQASAITPDIVRQLYRQYLGRDAMEHEIQGHLSNPGGVSGLTDTIMNSPEGLALRERPTAQAGSFGWGAAIGQAGQPSPGLYGQKPNTPQGGLIGAIATGAQNIASHMFGAPTRSVGSLWGVKPSWIQAGTVGGSAPNPWAQVGSAISTAAGRLSGRPLQTTPSGYAAQGTPSEPASYDEWLNARERGW